VPEVVQPLSTVVPCTSSVPSAMNAMPPGNTKSPLTPPSSVSVPVARTIMLPPPNDGSAAPAGRTSPGIAGRLLGGIVDPLGHSEGIDSVASPWSMTFTTWNAVPCAARSRRIVLPLLG
jgi:hypothetical protein